MLKGAMQIEKEQSTRKIPGQAFITSISDIDELLTEGV